MKKIIISDDRKLNISNIVVGYLQENKIEKLEFEIPKEYENFGRKACFEVNGKTFVKTFDNITGNTITLTRDITQYQDLFMTIAFFKTEDEDEIIARTSTLHILIQGAVICDDDVKPDEPKIIVLDNLIQKVQELDNEISLNENERLENENIRQTNEENRISNENSREEYITNLKDKVDDGEFNGKSLEFVWQGTKLGIRLQGQEEYQFVDLVGAVGPIGPQGNPFQVKKTYATINEMINDYDNMQINDYVMISGNIEEEDNAKLFVKTENETPIYRWQYLADFSGASGIQGPIGKTPNLKIGTVSTLNPNESATVEITGTDENPILNFGIPQGKTYQVNNEDLENIANEITSNANSSFNQNVLTKTNEFNNNATNKTTEFNTNADTKLQEYNTNADNKIAEYDAHSQELDNKIVSTRNELERVKNDVLETGTDTDTYIHLEDSAMAEYQELSVDGVCEQVTTIGKNLFDVSKLPMTLGGVTISVDKYGNVVLNGTPTITSDYINFIVSQKVEFKPDTYTMSVENKKVGIGTVITGFEGKLNLALSETGNSKTYTSTETYTATLQINVRYDVGTLNNFILNPQLETGETKTKYEPYTGEQPSPRPDFPQPISVIENSLKITSCNKNLFDKNKPNILNAYINVVNGEIGSDDATSIFVKCKQNTNYTISKIISSRFIVGTTSVKPQNKVMCNTFKRNDNGTNITISTNSNDKYLIVYVLNNKDELTLNQIFDSLMIEENPTVTSYEQHLETQIEVNLPEGEFIGKIKDTYKDTLKVEYNEEDGQWHKILKKMVGKVVLDGSENWRLFFNTNGIFSISSNQINAYKNSSSNNGISDNFIGKNRTYIRNNLSTTSLDNVFSIYGGDTSSELVFVYRNIATVNEFKTWLSTHNTEVYYALAEPYTVDLGIVDQLISYDKITNLFTDSDLMPQINAKYYRNFISTVRNLQVNEKALKQELIDINNRLSALETAQTSVASESEVIE